MKIYKCRKVQTPTRGTERSAGIDFYMPDGDNETVIHPHSDVLIPSGIYAEIPKGYMLIFADKSSICTKKKLFIGAKVIDEDYQGEIHIHLINWSNDYVKITPNQKIAQAILVPVNYESVSEYMSKDLLWNGQKTERGTGGFGSTSNEPFNTEAIGVGDIVKIKKLKDCCEFVENENVPELEGFIKEFGGSLVKVLETPVISNRNNINIQFVNEPEKIANLPIECLTNNLLDKDVNDIINLSQHNPNFEKEFMQTPSNEIKKGDILRISNNYPDFYIKGQICVCINIENDSVSVDFPNSNLHSRIMLAKYLEHAEENTNK
jgi:dUTP pyrophosphatase